MEKISIWQKGEYTYPLAFDFEPNLRPYLIDDGATHPCMLVLPGGGYAVVVPPEGELVAKRFNELGYNCFVMTYTTNQLCRVPVMDQAMRDLARAIRFVRKNASEYRVNPSQVYICGFSAAGHVCASVCDYWDSAASRQQATSAHRSAIIGMRSTMRTLCTRASPASLTQLYSPIL